jgi:hypothetical protein
LEKNPNTIFAWSQNSDTPNGELILHKDLTKVFEAKDKAGVKVVSTISQYCGVGDILGQNRLSDDIHIFMLPEDHRDNLIDNG